MPAATAYPSECARATAPGESRFRIRARIAPARAARIIALDERAEGVAHRLADGPWTNARFYVNRGRGGTDTPGGAVLLREIDGPSAPLEQVLTDTDVVVVLATEDGGRATAAAIGRHCWKYGITTAGVVLGDGFEAGDAVAALRPYARVLLLPADESDVSELLTALRV
ncbi:3-methyl-2-oxobutanoate hydroxymethyltransferase [Streptomyces sp. GMY02]|uniref:3-methyl-2-oxobutanoate hydroxymethyltransferase n=1 Tax=Streptomyces sp. GMY02 TaxID=1333528 RepID=UPI001C2C7B5B|nr:3-methyl-2-oxobutanoate hydroxymethyltransferase [Streptomyces sp. GMY02]QXE33009.1 3-methyl-2-oxobutanoate hydroxymethyltransferase [Streptomyces sp. GMY02]